MRKKLVAIALTFSLSLIISSLLLVSSEYVSITQTRKHTTSQYEPVQPIVIESINDLQDVGASGSGTANDPYIIRNLRISSDETCITVNNIAAHFIIFDCKLESSGNNPTILFENVENCGVVMCEIRGSGDGVRILDSQFCLISNTSISGTQYGLYFNDAENCTVINSRISNNRRGILFQSASYSRVVNNSIYSNEEYGLVMLWFSHNNTVIGNNIGWNEVSTALGSNAIDSGVDNEFAGNAWTDFNGSIPYMIPGDSESFDPSPQLLEDTNAPEIVPLPDIGIDEETSGNSMTWEVSDDYPLSFSILINNVLQTDLWFGENITLDLDSLFIGTNTIVLTLYDGANNSASDSVYVYVMSFLLRGLGTELVMIASGITVAVFAVVILLVKKLS